MRCHQARQKLTAPVGASVTDKDAEALEEHLRQCPSCARLAREERLLSADLEQLRHVEPPRALSIDQVRRAIAIRHERYAKTNLGVRIMQQVNDTIYKRPRLSLTVATAFVLILASVLVPVVPEHAVGYEVAFAAPTDGLILHEQNAAIMLAALNMDDARVFARQTEEGIEYRIAPIADTAQVRRLIEMLDSLGGNRVHSVATTAESEGKQTVWALLTQHREGSPTSPDKNLDREHISLDDLAGFTKDSFVLWIPTGGEQDDSLTGILINKEGDETNIYLPGLKPAADERGWNPWLNGNTVMKTLGPDGDSVEYDFTDINDVRKLEEMGYNFWLMEFDTPGQVPIPGMGPALNEIKPNPFMDETIVEYMVPQAYEITVRILDARGGDVRTLQECIVIAGIYQVTWDGLDAEGNRVEPGIYFCRFAAGDYVQTEEVKLVR